MGSLFTGFRRASPLQASQHQASRWDPDSGDTWPARRAVQPVVWDAASGDLPGTTSVGGIEHRPIATPTARPSRTAIPETAKRLGAPRNRVPAQRHSGMQGPGARPRNDGAIHRVAAAFDVASGGYHKDRPRQSQCRGPLERERGTPPLSFRFGQLRRPSRGERLRAGQPSRVRDAGRPCGRGLDRKLSLPDRARAPPEVSRSRPVPSCPRFPTARQRVRTTRRGIRTVIGPPWSGPATLGAPPRR